jgi:putative Holliday junction resolvase
LLERLRDLATQQFVTQIVVGIPLNMDGSSGDAVERVRRFVEDVAAALRLPVSTVDERLTTVEAGEIWRALTKKQQRKYRTVDSLAAALILERFLNEH